MPQQCGSWFDVLVPAKRVPHTTRTIYRDRCVMSLFVVCFFLIVSIDIQQVNLIIDLLGTPKSEYLDRINSESVSI